MNGVMYYAVCAVELQRLKRRYVEGNTVRVLLVEDDPEDTILIQRVLAEIKEWKASVVVCNGLDDALDTLARVGTDIALLDYHLGAENGLTFLKVMQTAGHEVPVILLTGRGDEQLAVEAMQAGAADYMPKSVVSPGSLQRAIVNALEKAKLQKLVKAHRNNLERTNSDFAKRHGEIESYYRTLSHELKTPLAGIQGFLALLLEEEIGEVNEQQRECVEIAVESCTHMKRCD